MAFCAMSCPGMISLIDHMRAHRVPTKFAISAAHSFRKRKGSEVLVGGLEWLGWDHVLSWHHDMCGCAALRLLWQTLAKRIPEPPLSLVTSFLTLHNGCLSLGSRVKLINQAEASHDKAPDT